MKNVTINWKTTIAGLIAIIPQILSIFNVELSPDLGNAINAIGILLIALMSKDWNVTGGNVNQGNG